jgi:hypothetical protein
VKVGLAQRRQVAASDSGDAAVDFHGPVIFMTFAFDRPFRGDLGIDAQPYQLIYDQLMKSNP